MSESAKNQPASEKHRREAEKHFPHGYEPWVAAWLIYEMLVAIDDINEGSLTRNGKSISPLLEPAMSLARTLARTLDVPELKGIET